MIVRATKSPIEKVRKMLCVKASLHHVQSGEDCVDSYLLAWRNPNHATYHDYVRNPPEGYILRELIEIKEVYVTFSMKPEDFYIPENIKSVTLANSDK